MIARTGDVTIVVYYLVTMPVSDDFHDYVLDQLEPIHPVTSRKMFGGVGVYHEGIMFALIYDDVVYFRVDDSNRPDFETAGYGQLPPQPSRPNHRMPYYEIPSDLLEDTDGLRPWFEKALAAARRAKSSSTRRRR